jgi:hypothetical protein
MEVEALISADDNTRYEYFIKRVADFEQVWGLAFNDGGWAFSGGDSAVAFPVWPFAEYAKRSATGAWQDCEPRAIELDEFMGRWLPGLKKDDRKVVAFPTPSALRPVREPDAVLSDLERELQKYAE